MLHKVSAYVANLAAFLTRNTPNYVGTVEGAVEKGLSICAHPVLAEDLETAWPSANFVYSKAGFPGMLDDYDANKCEVMAVGEMDTQGDISLMNKFCERRLLFTESLFIENVSFLYVQTF